MKCSPLFNIRYDARFSDAPAFIVATFEAPSIKNNNADINSKHSAHRVYSWNATEYGVRSIKDIVGG